MWVHTRGKSETAGVMLGAGLTERVDHAKGRVWPKSRHCHRARMRQREVGCQWMGVFVHGKG